jgi:hypothetical protein
MPNIKMSDKLLLNVKPWMSKLTRHLIFNMLDLKIHEHAWLLDVTLVSFVRQLTDVSKGS